MRVYFTEKDLHHTLNKNTFIIINRNYLSNQLFLSMLLRASSKVLRKCFSTYPKAMYDAWKTDPSKVHPTWNEYFKNNNVSLSVNPTSETNDASSDKQKDLALSAYLLIRYYKVNGHQIAELDPLRLQNFAEFGKVYAKNRLETTLIKNKVIKDEDLDIPFNFPKTEILNTNIAGFLAQKPQWTLRQIKSRLQQIYSDKLGIEYMYITSHAQKAWLMSQMQQIPKIKFSTSYKTNILNQLAKVESFNSFLNDKLKTSKRFGVEGLDSMISGLNHLVQQASGKGIEYIGFGMAHRGRLNALANVFHKPLQRIFAEFQENLENQSWGNSGDVKYHLGTTINRKIKDKDIRLSILPNPSHLETVDPVVMGHVKAVEDFLQNSTKTLGVLIHGDAAVAGQGIVYQCLQMGYLPHYQSNGVIHIVANNQIGFTTTPAQARTGLYCTDVARSIQAPVIHVNADQPQLVHKAMHIALEYRQKFHKDIFVDIIGYRRYGHNEQDQPAFTQPMMYQVISKRKSIYHLYAQKLVRQGVISQDQVDSMWSGQMKKLKQAYDQSSQQTFDMRKWKAQNYHRVVTISDLGQIKRTGLSKEALQQVGVAITKIPEGFNINSQIKKIYDARKQSIQTGQGIDFGTAQSLAFGSLIQEGFNIRLSGQDVERGTFSHRHAVLVDQKTEEKYMPLRNLVKPGEQLRVQIQNSLLSEYAAVGFQYGYSITKPTTLSIWEAQFGDFANGAQIVIDNYLTSGQSKWKVQTGLVLNLPHGMDGQGPEHSSCRIERFLQLMNDGWTTLTKQSVTSDDYRPLRKCNMQVVCCSTAGNLFHAYRRQVRRDYRKPLINILNKKLLKLRDASTNFEFLNNNLFATIIGETDEKINPQDVKKVVITYGQAYYSALEKRNQLQRKDVAFVRIQQLAPFNYMRFKAVIEQYPNATQFVWFQQEHRNSGPWGYIGQRVSFVLDWLKSQNKIKTSSLDLCSRKVSASTAVGKKKKHEEQQAVLLKDLFL